MKFTFSMTGPAWTKARPVNHIADATKKVAPVAPAPPPRQFATAARNRPVWPPEQPMEGTEAVATLVALGVPEREAIRLTALALQSGVTQTVQVVGWVCQHR